MTEQQQKPRIIAVTSGKGGVGKTNVAVNLAVSLRLFGVQVMLLDADMALGNVDILLGLDVRHDLREVLLEGKELEDVVVEGPRGIRILPGASGVEEMARLSDGQLESFLQKLRRYCARMDYVVVDTAPGISPTVINCLLAADELVVVTNPEPAALTDAYAVLKVLKRRKPEAGNSPYVVVNQTGSKEEALRSFDRLRSAAGRFLQWDLEYLGSVAADDIVSVAARRQVDFLTHYASAACSQDVRKLAARLVSSTGGGHRDMGRFFKKMMEPPGD